MALNLLQERLPGHISFGVTRDGRIFFVDDRTRKTSWIHPILGHPIQTGHSAVRGLPDGWEQAVTPEGAIYFIDHNTNTTTFEHPVTGRTASHDGHSVPQSPSSPHSPGNLRSPLKSPRSPTKLRALKAPAAKREQSAMVSINGWLYRQESGSLKSWKKRYCVLADFGLFFYKDDKEHHSVGSILLPSYRISPCYSGECNKRFAFKAEHNNMKTYFFATDSQNDMERWINALKSAASLKGPPKRSPEPNNNKPKLIPKSAFMEWDDDDEGDPNKKPGGSQVFFPPSKDIPNTQSAFGPYQGQGQPRSTSAPINSRGQSPEESPQGYQHSPLKPSAPNYPGEIHSHPNYPADRNSRASNYGNDQRPNEQNYESLSRYHNTQPPIQNYSHQGQRSNNQDQRNRYPTEPARKNDNSTQRSHEHGYPVHQSHDQNKVNSRMRPQEGYPNYSEAAYDRLHGKPPGDDRIPPDSSNYPQSSSNYPHGQDNLYSKPLKKMARDLSPHERFEGRGGRQDKDHRVNHGDPREQSYWSRHENDPYVRTAQDPRTMERPDLIPNSNHSRETSETSNYGYYSPQRAEAQQLNRLYGQDNPSHDPRVLHHGKIKHSSEPDDVNKQQPKEPPRLYLQDQTQQNQPPRSDGNIPNNNLYVDIPHTYVNIGDALSHRYDNETSPLPNRPPLPTAVRSQYVEELAQLKTPQTSQELLEAERNLEQRMQQPAYFSYPTPTMEERQFPMPNSDQYSSHHAEPRYISQQHQPNTLGIQDQDPRRPNDCHDQSKTDDSTLVREFRASSRAAQQQATKEVLKGPDASDLARRRMSSPDNSSTNKLYLDRQTFDGNETSSVEQFKGRDSNPTVNQGSNIIRTHRSENAHNRTAIPKSANHRNSIDSGNVKRYNNLFIQNAPMNEKHTNVKQQDPPRFKDSQHEFRHDGEMFSPQGNSHENGDDESETDIKRRLSNASSQVSYNPGRWDEQASRADDGRLVPDHKTDTRGRGGKKPVGGGIHTVKEDPDMPDSQIIETAGIPNINSKYPGLGGGRIRMSISAGDLIGKTHDELVLMLIQLRREQTSVEKLRNFYRERIEQGRPAELRYKQLIQESRSALDPRSEQEHEEHMEFRFQLEEVEKKLEVYRPLVNLVHNMVNMGSLYGGDNYMMATQYRKHLLSPEEYTPPKKMIEFSRKYQEEEIVRGMKDDIKQLTKDEVDLEEKLERLYELDRLLQEQSFRVTSHQGDKDLLEKALSGILRQQDMSRDNPRDLDSLIRQQRTIEKELSRVMHHLAEASKELEETTAENNKVEHEVTLLRSKVQGDLNRSKSAPSLSDENYKNKMKMEKDLARVQDIMAGLNEQQAELSEAMKRLRRSSSGAGLDKLFTDSDRDTNPVNKSPKEKLPSTYMETDVDTLESKDLSQVHEVLHSFTNATSLNSQYPSSNQAIPDSTRYETIVGQKNESFGSSPTSPQDHTRTAEIAAGEWDISEADDNTKRFFGILPKEKPKVLTVRDVKRQSEQRKEFHKTRKEEPVADSPWSSYKSGQDKQVEQNPGSTAVNGNHPVYENLPPVNSTHKSWSSVLPSNSSSAPSSRRSSSLHLMGPRPFVPFHLQQSNTPSPVTISHVESPVQMSNMNSTFQQPRTDDVVKATRVIIQPPFNGTEEDGDNQPAVYTPKPFVREYSPVKTGLFNIKRTPRGRYMTISSSQPVKLETSLIQPTSLHTSAGDLMTNNSMDMVPDIVKSSRTTVEPDQMDEAALEREILYMPSKVEIPERYLPDSDEESVTEEEKIKREEKAEKIKRLLTNSSVQHSLSQPDVSKVAGEIHQKVQEQKMKRAHLLAVSQELAKQVTLKSRQAAAERAQRRKTWSGSPSKGSDPILDPDDLEVDRTMGSLEYLAPHHRIQENMYI